MRLSQFIQDTLYEIVLGVHLGRARSLDIAAISPNTISGDDVAEKSYIEFDVAVVVNEGDTKVAGADGRAHGEIQVAAVFKASLGGGGKTESTAMASIQQTHRVTFKVPVFLNAHFVKTPWHRQRPSTYWRRTASPQIMNVARVGLAWREFGRNGRRHNSLVIPAQASRKRGPIPEMATLGGIGPPLSRVWTHPARLS